MPTFELITVVNKVAYDKKGYTKEEISDIIEALKLSLIKWDSPTPFPYTVSIKEVTFVAPTNYLETHYFDIAQLRLMLAELTKDGIHKISVNNLLLYIKGIATQEGD